MPRAFAQALRRDGADRPRSRARYSRRAHRARGLLAGRRRWRCTRRCVSRDRSHGVMALSTYLPLAPPLAAERSADERRHPDLHGAWHVRPSACRLSLDGVVAPRARCARLCRGLALVFDAALGLQRGNRRDRRVAHRPAREPKLSGCLDLEAFPHLGRRAAPRVERSLGERGPARRVHQHDGRAARAVARSDDEVRTLVALFRRPRREPARRAARIAARRERGAPTTVRHRRVRWRSSATRRRRGALLNECRPAPSATAGARLLANQSSCPS